MQQQFPIRAFLWNSIGIEIRDWKVKATWHRIASSIRNNSGLSLTWVGNIAVTSLTSIPCILLTTFIWKKVAVTARLKTFQALESRKSLTWEIQNPAWMGLVSEHHSRGGKSMWSREAASEEVSLSQMKKRGGKRDSWVRGREPRRGRKWKERERKKNTMKDEGWKEDTMKEKTKIENISRAGRSNVILLL